MILLLLVESASALARLLSYRAMFQECDVEGLSCSLLTHPVLLTMPKGPETQPYLATLQQLYNQQAALKNADPVPLNQADIATRFARLAQQNLNQVACKADTCSFTDIPTKAISTDTPSTAGSTTDPSQGTTTNPPLPQNTAGINAIPNINNDPSIDNDASNESSLTWLWIVLGVLAGALLIAGILGLWIYRSRKTRWTERETIEHNMREADLMEYAIEGGFLVELDKRTSRVTKYPIEEVAQFEQLGRRYHEIRLANSWKGRFLQN